MQNIQQKNPTPDFYDCPTCKEEELLYEVGYYKLICPKCQRFSFSQLLSHKENPYLYGTADYYYYRFEHLTKSLNKYNNGDFYIEVRELYSTLSFQLMNDNTADSYLELGIKSKNIYEAFGSILSNEEWIYQEKPKFEDALNYKGIDTKKFINKELNKEEYYIRNDSFANQRYDTLSQAVVAIDTIIR